MPFRQRSRRYCYRSNSVVGHDDLKYYFRINRCHMSRIGKRTLREWAGLPRVSLFCGPRNSHLYFTVKFYSKSQRTFRVTVKKCFRIGRRYWFRSVNIRSRKFGNRLGVRPVQPFKRPRRHVRADLCKRLSVNVDYTCTLCTLLVYYRASLKRRRLYGHLFAR